VPPSRNIYYPLTLDQVISHTLNLLRMSSSDTSKIIEIAGPRMTLLDICHYVSSLLGFGPPKALVPIYFPFSFVDFLSARLPWFLTFCSSRPYLQQLLIINRSPSLYSSLWYPMVRILLQSTKPTSTDSPARVTSLLFYSFIISTLVGLFLWWISNSDRNPTGNNFPLLFNNADLFMDWLIPFQWSQTDHPWRYFGSIYQNKLPPSFYGPSTIYFLKAFATPSVIYLSVPLFP